MTYATDDLKLNRSEWRAVSVGLQDAAQCGCDDMPGSWTYGFTRLVRLMTGREGPQPLADGRLEALRNFICATRRRRHRADEFVPDLLEQGFNRRQVEAIALLSA